MGLGRNREISVFESTDKGKWGDGDKEKKDRETRSNGHGVKLRNFVSQSTDKGTRRNGDKER
jgi:hypothetical protein